jgi:membrane protein YdbS with pleckstrin-like domain/uncharacterized damage-inducible protein DinB
VTLFTTIDDVVRELEVEAQRTLAVLSSLDEPSLRSRVGPGLRTLAEVAWHLPQSLKSIARHTGLDVDAPDPQMPAPSSPTVIKEVYETAVVSLIAAIRVEWDDTALAIVDDVYGAQWTRGHTLRVVLDHEIHHRGQLIVLMRQAGLRPPAIYGPVAEDDGYDSEAAEVPPVTRQLDPRIQNAWRIEHAIWTVILTGGAATLETLLLPRWSWWPFVPWVLSLAVFGLFLLTTLFWPGLAWRRWSYTIRAHDVLLAYGVLWRVRRSVPRPRIQHVDVRSGPIDRAFGLVKCTLYTAGTGEADATIPGLEPEDAEAIRERLISEDWARV